MRVVVAGASGLIGTALVAHLRGRGDDVVRLVRGPARAPDERSWDPAAGELDPSVLRGADGVVNLGGAGLGDRRWTASYKETIRVSRVDGTSLLSRTLAHLADGPDHRPGVLVQGTAVGFYGDRGTTSLDESAARGAGFIPGVVEDWELATSAASSAGVRVALARTGIVLARGGALSRLIPLARLGLAGRLGRGDQHWAWIGLTDEVRALTFLLDHEVSGPVNLVSPEPATCAEVIRALARAFGRPAPVPVPAWALRVALGEFTSELTSSQRVVPGVLAERGFEFTHPTLTGAIHAAVSPRADPPGR
ncbi:MAG: TIGR01777 family protein [Actinomycetales bacterium]|nr:TIGR01777 family protein [Actinomycetales bacterium]